MNLAALIKGAIALGIPRIARSNSGAPAGLVDPASGKIIPNTLVGAAPSTAQVYTSPIAGDPDTAAQYSFANLANHLVTGFLLPQAGILTEIGYIAQGNAGAGANSTLRWTVASVTQDPTAATGLALEAILGTNTTTVADNYNGVVALATGLSIAVPAQFVIAIKAGLGQNQYAQLMRSGGPLPGVVGSIVGSVLTSAATYSTTTLDVNVTPAPLVAGEKLSTLLVKGLSIYIKWKGQ